MKKRDLNFGLIGSGFMGRTHAFGLSIANRVFDLPYNLHLKKIADVSEFLASKAAQELSISQYTSKWKELIQDPSIHVINITSPNAFHKEMALAAIKAGKHVYCEKPLSSSVMDSKEMASAAKSSKIKTQVGFNYICNPLFVKAREMVNNGDLGEIRGFRGIHAEDYMASSDSPFTWRHDPVGGGVLADLGSHIIATAEFLLGPISEVLGSCVTSIDQRKDLFGNNHNVVTDDITRAFLKFENGVSGSIEANWVAMGRKMQHDFEIFGSEGALSFSQERLNELLFYKDNDPSGEKGFKTIFMSPDHEPYGQFCIAPGHQLGFADLKAIEFKGFVDAIAGLRSEPFNFQAGLRVQSIVELIQKSSAQTKWLAVSSP